MLAELIGPNDARWRKVLEGAAHDVYHLPGYGPLYEREPRVEEVALYIHGERGELLAPLMLRSLPDLGVEALAGAKDAASPYGYPGPVCRGAFAPDEERAVRDAVHELLSKHGVVTCFIRAHPLIPSGDALLEQLGVAVEHGEVAIIELDQSDDRIWRGYQAQHRRRVVRLRDAGYSVRFDQWEDLDAFRAIYMETMRRVSASAFYAFDRSYFERLRVLLAAHLHLAVVVAPNGAIVAGGIHTECRGVVNAHLSGTTAAELDNAPSKLLFDEIWRWAKQRGHRLVNLGGGLGGNDDSLFRFKRGFATSTRPFRTIRIVGDEDRYRAACRAVGAGDERTEFFPAYRRPRSSSAVATA